MERLGVSKKPQPIKCDEELLKECKFSDFSKLLDIAYIPADLGGAVATVNKYESANCALLHKQLIKCIKDAK